MGVGILCGAKGCKNEVEENSTYCKSCYFTKIKCANCNGKRVPGKPYCITHCQFICNEDECGEEVMAEARNILIRYKPDYFAHCYNFNQGLAYCKKHKDLKYCNIDHCPSRKLPCEVHCPFHMKKKEKGILMNCNISNCTRDAPYDICDDHDLDMVKYNKINECVGSIHATFKITKSSISESVGYNDPNIVKCTDINAKISDIAEQANRTQTTK
jgi:hypothetical protein